MNEAARPNTVTSGPVSNEGGDVIEKNEETILGRVDRYLETFLYYTSAGLLIAISCAVFYVVVARYFFDDPPLWAEDAPRVFFLWMVYLAIAVATKRGQNIRVTHFIDKFPARARLVTEIIMHILVLIMLAVLFWYAFPVLRLQAGGTMLSTGWSYVWAYIPLPLGCVLMTLYQVKLMLRSIEHYRSRRQGA